MTLKALGKITTEGKSQAIFSSESKSSNKDWKGFVEGVSGLTEWKAS